ncbi:LarC family nickel insertion protein [Caldicellulosiruptor morganii]|uniref:LarC family nickel insertion protein n=1 Tax=Caldicellulosiruptor morganii TaxID=1387555 RepID=A0ABY7BNB9_9FIRM|nr:LarC family nickel insertion protein [Caldicellulosiruptor morganii]WAM33021.1 LarC family nickel insertion protein [Caldicellulosiruptor morganii]
MIIYFNAPSGISGDMLVSSLIDAGVDFEYLKSNIDLLGLDVEIGIKEKTVNGIKAKSFVVDVLHHHHNNDQGHHHHRTFKDIKKLLQESKLQETVKDLSLKIFEKIAKAEAAVHGMDIEEVAFHEVGADDSIVDIVAFSLCMEYLKPQEVLFSPLCDGRGFTKSMHGIIPVPAPAVLEIARQNGIPLATLDIDSELVTPTGIGIAAAVSNGFVNMPRMQIEKIGYGSGTKDLPIPNIVRAIIGKKN